MTLEYLEIMKSKESKELEKPQIQDFSFMVEVIKRENFENQFIVRVAMPCGSAAVVVMGNINDLKEFIDSL